MEPEYLFWPETLNGKERYYAGTEIVAIAIQLKDTDKVVLDIIPRDSIAQSVESPYYIVASREKSGKEWIFAHRRPFIVSFKPPNMALQQFFSIEPISLALPEKKMDIDTEVALNNSVPSLVEIWNYKRYQKDVNRLKETLLLLNFYHTHLVAFQQKYNAQPTKSPASIWSKFWSRIRVTKVYSATCHALLYVLALVCTIATFASTILNWRYASLVSWSAFAQQIDLRCQQVCYFPVQYLRINENVMIRNALPRFRNSSEASANLRKDLPSKYYPDYIRFYNTIWLILNDISFGLILSAFLIEYRENLVKVLHTGLKFFLYDSLKAVTMMLAKNPFGIKLNQELAQFLSDLFDWIIEFSYLKIIRYLINPHTLNKCIYWLSCTSCLMGATFALSLFVDFCSVLSVHVYLFYRISSKIYHWQLNVMTCLFYLFCGKKRNVLRNRVDHHNFELDQLLLGTILFVILVFLAPTVFVYYIAYTTYQLGAISVEISLDSLIALLNHFPLFALLLRIKDPKRIPGGISLLPKKKSATEFELKIQPLGIRQMFKPFAALMQQMKASYCSLHTLKSICRGEPITVNRNKLCQVLYSSLPNTPISINTLWASLQDSGPEAAPLSSFG